MFYRLVDANDSCMYAEIRTRIPDIIPQDYVIEDDSGVPISFAVKVSSHAVHVGDSSLRLNNLMVSLNQCENLFWRFFPIRLSEIYHLMLCGYKLTMINYGQYDGQLKLLKVHL